ALIASTRMAAEAATAPPVLVSTLPGDSVYRLHPHLVDQDGRALVLASRRGTPMIASMFYSSCDMVCPLIFETIAQTRKALPPARRDRIDVLMVSFDPERDTVAQLKETAQAHGCDEHWTLARADERD